MQKVTLKFLFFLSTFSFISFYCHAQADYRLEVADSLFAAKRYTQSFDQYHAILEQHQYSPAMLLRMAYIQEGLNHIGQAMVYLNLYFLATNDKTVLTKMEQMASKFNLEGYEASDSVRILSFYHDYYSQITISLITLSIVMMSLIFYTRTNLNRRPIASGIMLIIMLCIFFVHVNFGQGETKAVVMNKNTFVMSGPSAGAPVASIVDEGHRVSIVGEEDVWLEILWRGDVGYVKNNSLIEIRL